MKVPLSVLIPTRNEQDNMDKCLASVAWADQIVVVDSRSTDATAAMAREHGARVVEFAWDGIGPRKKNWALENVAWKNEWILLLDADEEVTEELGREIALLVESNPPEAAFLIRFHYEFLGRRLRHGDPLWKLCLVRHGHQRFEHMDVPEVHEYDVELHEWVKTDGAIGRLRGVILHRDFEDLHHYLDRHNVYSDWEALLRARHGRRDRSGEVAPRLLGSAVERRRFLKRLFLALPGKPWLYFFYSYILRGGFLDGRAGFTYNALKAIYWYEVSLKEYEIRRREKGRLDPSKEGPTTGEQRKNQLDFYQEQVDPEEEITRPRCYPRPVQFQLERKLSAALDLLMRRLRKPLEGRTALVVCCGSGMESEFLARRGLRLVALDISLDAVRRARERAARFGVDYQVVVGDAEHLPFRDESFSLAFVHDGLHHLPDAYQGIREMMRVAREAAVVAEPADAAMTRLSVKLGISGKYEEAGNYVYRLQPRRVAGVFREAGAESWDMRRDVFYYQPWTFPIYRWLERGAGWWVFRAGFHVVNALLGRWGNSLKAVAIKREAWSGAD